MTRVNWIRKRFLLLNRRHRYLTVLFATAPCDVALEFRSETAVFFPPPPFCRFAVIYHNPTFSSSYLSSPSIHRARARSNEISHIAESHLNATRAPATLCSAAHWKQCAASPLCMPMRPRARCVRLNILNPGTGLKVAEASVKMCHIGIASYAHLRKRDAQKAEQSVTPLCLPSAVQGESAHFTRAHPRARTRTRHRQTRARKHTITLTVAMPLLGKTGLVNKATKLK